MLERLVLLRLHLGPAPMLDLLGAQGFRVLVAANALGVFDALAKGPASAETVAERIGAHGRGTQLLLESLEALRYLERRGQAYRTTRMARRWLPIVRPGIEFFAWETLERWDHLEAAVRDGTPAPDRQRDAAFQRMYQAGMRTVAALTADEVVSKVRVPANARRLLDVGGGHGLHSARFCRRHPGLTAIVFDLPEARRETLAGIRDASLEGRMSFRGGDFFEDDLGRGYDVVLLFDVVHMFEAERNGALVRRLAESLRPGGRLIVMDQLAGRVRGATARAAARLTALNLFVGTGGQTYAAGEIEAWMRGAGLTKTEHRRLLRTPGFGLVSGHKPA